MGLLRSARSGLCVSMREWRTADNVNRGIWVLGRRRVSSLGVKYGLEYGEWEDERGSV